MAGLLSRTANQNFSADQIRNAVLGAKNKEEVYNLALKHNVSGQQIADAMRGERGYTLDNINKYDSSRSAQQPLLNNANNRSVLFGAGNNDVTGQNIRDYIVQPNRTGDEIIDKAIQYGVNVDQITDAMTGYKDFAPDNVTQYLESKGYVNPNQAVVDTQTRNRELGVPQAKPIEYSSYKPTFVTPTIAQQDLQRGTVSGQLNTILNPNSPLMQKAQTFGNQMANRRGLLNSSLGISAAQDAMIGQALPIATADAASANQFALTNAQNQQQANLFNSDLSRQYDLTKLGISKDMAINAENIARDYGLAHLDIENKVQIANINAASKSSSDAAALNDRMLVGITQINQQDISQEAKDRQIKTLVEATDSAIAMLGAFDRIGQSLAPRGGNDQTAPTDTNQNASVNTNTENTNNGATNNSSEPVITQGGFPITEREADNIRKLKALGHQFDDTKVVTLAEMDKIRASHPKYGKYVLEQWLDENTKAFSLPGSGSNRGPGPVTFVRVA